MNVGGVIFFGGVVYLVDILRFVCSIFCIWYFVLFMGFLILNRILFLLFICSKMEVLNLKINRYDLELGFLLICKSYEV